MEALTWWQLLLAFGSGYAMFFRISKYVYDVCPACAASHFDEATMHRFNEIATAMTIALAIHCPERSEVLQESEQRIFRFEPKRVRNPERPGPMRQ